MDSQKLNDRLQLIGMLGINAHRYPGFMRMVDSWIAWSDEGFSRDESLLVFGAAINRRIAELAEIEPNPDYDTKFCGM